MYDDDLFGMLNSYTTTETEQETNSQTNLDSYSQYNQTQSPYVDDYRTTQNFEEERSYNGYQTNSDFEESKSQSVIRQMDAPMVQKQAPAVKLTKTREKLYLSARLKCAMTVMAIIFVAIVFATIWNFAQASRLSANVINQQNQITEISQSINKLKLEYNELNDVSDQTGYVDKVEGVNSFTISLDEFYEEPEIEKIPSNWFNDVCEFFSKMFA